MNREELIYFALKYNGEYFRICRAIEKREKAYPIQVERCITLLDPDYPPALLDLEYPPFVLFYRGNKELLKTEIIAVVGSRLPCAYALKMTDRLCRFSKDKTIISGLAKGIDAQAHLSSQQTIGVLGCGIDVEYPSENRTLIRSMKENQLVLSEYPSMVKPYSHHFPFRNRIIAALSQSVYVMQCVIQSGTMTTVNEALKLGKDIYCLPYRSEDREGSGNNKLLSEGANFILEEDLAS